MMPRKHEEEKNVCRVPFYYAPIISVQVPTHPHAAHVLQRETTSPPAPRADLGWICQYSHIIPLNTLIGLGEPVS